MSAVTRSKLRELSERCVRELQARGLTVASAESCTGGLIAKSITDIPGSSAVFAGAAVTYTDEVKIGFLGVPRETVRKFHAVSPQTAEAMAKAAALNIGADIGVSTTGIAGPSSDESGQPVGTVFIGLYHNGKTAIKSLTEDLGSRDANRVNAAGEALKSIISELKG